MLEAAALELMLELEESSSRIVVMALHRLVKYFGSALIVID